MKRLNTSEIPTPTEGSSLLSDLCLNLLLMGSLSYTGICSVVVYLLYGMLVMGFTVRLIKRIGV